MSTKKTISASIDPFLVDKAQDLAESLGVSRSHLFGIMIEKFLYAHEKAELIKDPQEYLKKTLGGKSHFCPTHIGVMMNFNFDIDFVVRDAK